MLSRHTVLTVVFLTVVAQLYAADHLTLTAKGKKEQGKDYDGLVVSFDGSTLEFSVASDPKTGSTAQKLTPSATEYQMQIRLAARPLKGSPPDGGPTAWIPGKDRGQLVWLAEPAAGAGTSGKRDSVWAIHVNKDGTLISNPARPLPPSTALQEQNCGSCHAASDGPSIGPSAPVAFYSNSAPGSLYEDKEGRGTTMLLFRGPEFTSSHPWSPTEHPEKLGAGNGVFDMTSCLGRGEDSVLIPGKLLRGMVEGIGPHTLSIQEKAVSFRRDVTLENGATVNIGFCPNPAP